MCHSPATVRKLKAAACFAMLMSLAMAAATLLLVAAPARAADESDLLPVDEAFVLNADAADARSVKLRWRIADGYYLYRHRISVRATAPAQSGNLQLPHGKAHRDEFFGDTETYRRELIATLPLTDSGGAARVSLEVKYQGCADIGICYPPQTRTLAVALRSTDRDSAVATADEDSGDHGALGRALSGIGGASSRPSGLNATPLPEEQAFAVDAITGDGNTVLLRFTPAKGYYLYRDRTTIRLRSGDEPVMQDKIAWPAATPWHDEHFGTVQVYFSQIDVRVPVLRASAKALPIDLEIEFQGCQTDGICYPPMRRKVALTLPAGAKISPVAVALRDAGTRANAQKSVTQAATTTTSPISATDSTATTSTTGSPTPLANTSNASNDASAAASMPASHTAAVAANSNDGASQARISNIWWALLLALVGGVVLNLMPCVLPVLSLKALGLAASGETPGKARAHALWYTAGVLVSFLALGGLAIALRKAGMALGWGFQLQQPLVVASLALVMFAFGLSLSGLWYVGGRWTGVGHGLASRSSAVGDFFTGVLAVVVAAPCTAPYMAPALGWAFTAPTFAALLVFFALGLGLALPFLLLGFVPALAQRLPKPGAWMETLKQFLAFPMYLTAIWLMWVLIKQRGADAGGWLAIAALALAFAAWAWRRRALGARWAMPALLLAAVVAAVALRMIAVLPHSSVTTTASASPSGDDADLAVLPFSEQRLADLRRAGRVVLVNMTADWCVTCKANEKAVFARDGFHTALAKADAVYMVGDWTTVDPAITTYLKRYNAVGVPLYVVYPRNGGPGRALPTVLTPGLVHDALAQAAIP